MYGADLGGFFILRGAERHMRRVEKEVNGLKVAAEILRAQAHTSLSGKHGPKDLEGQGGTQAFERGSSFLDSDTSTYIPIYTHYIGRQHSVQRNQRPGFANGLIVVTVHKDLCNK